jgi:parallel beta-helix repeat protein
LEAFEVSSKPSDFEAVRTKTSPACKAAGLFGPSIYSFSQRIALMFSAHSLRRLVRLVRPSACAPSRRPAALRKPRLCPSLEILEDRCLLSVFAVTNTLDAGPGSLRQAILDSNGTPGPNTIDFAIADTGVHTIQVGTTTGIALPAITNAVTIDGYSQPGAQANSLAAGDNAVLLIDLDGAATYGGLVVTASGVTIEGLVIENFNFSGVSITGAGASGNVIAGNWIGIDASGTIARGNASDGVSIDSAASGNMIGGTSPGARNVISGNVGRGVGMYSGASANVIEGNYIGTDLTGTNPLGNSLSAVDLEDGTFQNTIGGTAPAARNVLSGNLGQGVRIYNSAGSNLVEGNYIGTDVTGTQPLGNALNGVVVVNSPLNTIGGIVAGASNVISGNALDGVLNGASNNLVQGNYIGTDITGTQPLGNGGYGVALVSGASGNTIDGSNVISANAYSGIALFSASSNLVQGNDIGTDVSGTQRLGNGNYGVYLDHSSSGNTIGGGNVISGNMWTGIGLDGSSGNLVQGNYIGTDKNGTQPLGNARYGVGLYNGAAGNTIGGTTAGARNVISGNTWSGVVLFSSSNNVVQGDYIGTDVSGTGLLGNGNYGVSLASGSSGNTIDRNVISGNTFSGVALFSSSNNVVQGNYIGTDVSGTQRLGNGNYGVYLDHNSSGNTIGGGNVISGNMWTGIGLDGSSSNLVQGNYIGTDKYGTQPLGNARYGVGLYNGAAGNTIGGMTAGARNVISGNTWSGVALFSSSNNVVQGDYIGTDVNGTGLLGNGNYGVSLVSGARGNTIDGNVISGNTWSGVALFSSSNNVVQGDYIGTDAMRTQRLGNGQNGVYLDSGSNDNLIYLNVVSANVLDGVNINGGIRNTLMDNYIGTNSSFANVYEAPNLGNGHNGVGVYNGARNNTIGEHNYILYNGGYGVRVGSNCTGILITGNWAIYANLGVDMGHIDGIDTDPGGNGGIQHPGISLETDAYGGGTVHGSFHGTDPDHFSLEFYDSATDGEQGAIPMGTGASDYLLITYDPANHLVTFVIAFPHLPPQGTFLSCTLTGGGWNGTSEFSNAIPIPTDIGGQPSGGAFLTGTATGGKASSQFAGAAASPQGPVHGVEPDDVPPTPRPTPMPDLPHRAQDVLDRVFTAWGSLAPDSLPDGDPFGFWGAGDTLQNYRFPPWPRF